jgi:hypothetical protein
MNGLAGPCLYIRLLSRFVVDTSCPRNALVCRPHIPAVRPSKFVLRPPTAAAAAPFAAAHNRTWSTGRSRYCVRRARGGERNEEWEGVWVFQRPCSPRACSRCTPRRIDFNCALSAPAPGERSTQTASKARGASGLPPPFCVCVHSPPSTSLSFHTHNRRPCPPLFPVTHLA